MEYNGSKISFHVRFGAWFVMCVEIIRRLKILLYLWWYAFVVCLWCGSVTTLLQALVRRLGVLGNAGSRYCLPKLMPFFISRKATGFYILLGDLHLLKDPRDREKGSQRPFQETLTFIFKL